MLGPEDPGFPPVSGKDMCSVVTNSGYEPGSCETVALERADGWTVSFTEHWAYSVSAASARVRTWTVRVGRDGLASFVGIPGAERQDS